MKIKLALCAVTLLGAVVANTSMAMDQGDWLIRLGATSVEPKSTNSPLVSVDSAASLTVNFTYMMTENWGVEVLGAYPFEHDINLVDGTEVGSTKHLPPTVSLQYHFLPKSVFQPYIGAGINYTTFFDEELHGPLEGSHLNLDDSWGWAGELGADFMLGDSWFLNVSIRYLDIQTDATIDGAPRGEVAIDPWVYGGHVGFRF